MWILKFKRLLRYFPKSFADSSMETISILIENPTDIMPDLFLIDTIALNFSALTIIWISENHFIAASDSTSSKFIGLLIVLAKQDQVFIIYKVKNCSIFSEVKEIIKKSVETLMNSWNYFFKTNPYIFFSYILLPFLRQE